MKGEVVYLEARRSKNNTPYWRIGILEPGNTKPSYVSMFGVPWFRVGDHVELEVDEKGIAHTSRSKKLPSVGLADIRARIINAACILAARSQRVDPVSAALDIADKLEEWVMRPVEPAFDPGREYIEAKPTEEESDVPF